ncbi:major facilitator superfamily domain-containing protein [Lentinula aff. detonsa]|uniref:Major facilitator superfamily domain-containing protein n=1 Tax=Lentinula aff. detonsa TaxID=2804958 RepID=A0AA38L3N8_9AGAR|nr:major facilitator superfamily domain-containing protein [Lentinula aff. detonsa]
MLPADSELGLRDRTMTPLPKVQVFIVILMQLTEPISATVIFPFINQMVLSTGITGGDEKKSGYYAGVIESVFFLSESLTTMLWGHASDRYGRRPVLLLGPLGLAVVTSLFGLSTKYWTLIVFRSLQGVFNGNLGVSKTVLAELSDATNMATAFSFTSVMWQVGVTIGCSLGGVLSNPADHWPQSPIGRSPLLRNHPYLLPCAITGFISFFIFLVAFTGLKETRVVHDPNVLESPSCASFVPSQCTTSASMKRKKRMCLHNIHWPGTKKGAKDLGILGTTELEDGPTPQYGSTAQYYPTISRPRSTSEETLVGVNDYDRPKNAEVQRTISFRTLLTSEDVLRPLSSLALLSFLETSISVLIPITYTTSVANGGLGLTAMQVGSLLSIGGAVSLVFSAIGIPPLVRYFGIWKMHFVGMSALIVGFSCIIMASLAAKRAGYADELTWTFVMIQYASYIILPLGFTTAQMFVVNGAPSRDALGTTNGMVQSARTLARTIAPVCVMSLFSISKEQNLLHGQLSYVVCLLITICGLRNVLKLPRKLSRL